MKSFNMDMELYYMPKTRSDRTLWAIRELGIEDKVVLKKVQIFEGQQFSEEFKAVNPMCQIPTLALTNPETGKKHVMTESAAIAQFLTEVTESDLQPSLCNVLARAQYYRIASLAATSIDTMVYTIVVNELIAPEDKRDKKAAAKARADFAGKTLKTLEEILDVKDGEKQVEYICEPHHKGFTIADVILGQILIIADSLDLLATSPLVKAYVDRLQKRPAFSQMLSDEA